MKLNVKIKKKCADNYYGKDGWVEKLQKEPHSTWAMFSRIPVCPNMEDDG